MKQGKIVVALMTTEFETGMPPHGETAFVFRGDDGLSFEEFTWRVLIPLSCAAGYSPRLAEELAGKDFSGPCGKDGE